MTSYRDVIGAIGRTPLIRLRAASEATGCTILGKAEFMNPGGSVKDRAALAIIKAVKAIVSELGIDMLVEGVETMAQLEILRANGADEAQGYLFSKPRPAATPSFISTRCNRSAMKASPRARN